MSRLLFLLELCITFALLSPGISVALAEMPFKPAVVYQWDIESNSYNKSIHNGVQRLAEKTGELCIEKVVNGDVGKYVAEVEALANKGYSPIILPYGGHYPKLVLLARKYIRTRFIVFDTIKDEPNIYSFTLSMHEGSFLAGALAALTSQSGVIGFVSVTDIPSLRSFLCGYTQGAKYISPEISVLSGFTGRYPQAWFDGKATAALAHSLMDKGADVIFQAAGAAGPAVLKTAAERGKLGIGVDVNQNGLYPGSVLTSVVKRMDMVVYASLILAKRKVWRDNIRRTGLAQGAVDIIFDNHNASLITPEIREQINELKRGIIMGEIHVHDYQTEDICW